MHRVPWSIAATPARLRPPGRRGLRPSSCCDPGRPMVPCTLVGAAWAPSCVRGRRGSPRLRQPRGGCRALAPTRLPGSSMASPAPGARMQRGRGHRVLHQRMSASPVRRRGVLLGPVAAVGAAGSAVPQQHQARSRGASRCRAVVPGTVGLTPSTPVPGAASATITHGHRMVRHPAARVVPAWGTAVGHREARAPASVPSNPTRACRRRRIASAPASLRLLAAPDPWRSASGQAA